MGWALAVRGELWKPWTLGGVLVGVGLVGWVAVLARPVNVDYVEWIDFDPQGPEQQFWHYYLSGVFQYTSGFMCGQFTACLLGALIVIGDRAGYRLSVKLVAAVLGGLLFAVVNLAVVLLTVPAAIGAPPMTAAEVQAAGMTFDPNLLRNSELWWVMGTGLVAFPLYAAVGVGIGALVTRWWVLPAMAVVWWSLALCLGWQGTEPRPPWLYALLGMLPPASSFISIGLTAKAQNPWKQVPAPGLAHASLLVGLLAYATVLCTLARRPGVGRRGPDRTGQPPHDDV